MSKSGKGTLNEKSDGYSVDKDGGIREAMEKRGEKEKM